MRACHLIALFTCAACLFACNEAKQPSRQPWIDPASARPGPLQHEQLTSAQIERIEKVQQTFSEVDPSRLDKWVEDFKRDRDPEREIRIYEGMADAYAAYCAGRTLTLPAKNDVYQWSSCDRARRTRTCFPS